MPPQNQPQFQTWTTTRSCRASGSEDTLRNMNVHANLVYLKLLFAKSEFKKREQP